MSGYEDATGSASRTLRERVAAAIRKQIRVDAAPPPINHYIFGIEEAADAAIAEVMAWQPIEMAPKDRPIWGKVGDNAIRMFWHEKFGGFISSFNRMTMAPGYLINGEPYEDHSPQYVDAKGWMEIPSPPNRGEK